MAQLEAEIRQIQVSYTHHGIWFAKYDRTGEFYVLCVEHVQGSHRLCVRTLTFEDNASPWREVKTESVRRFSDFSLEIRMQVLEPFLGHRRRLWPKGDEEETDEERFQGMTNLEVFVKEYREYVQSEQERNGYELAQSPPDAGRWGHVVQPIRRQFIDPGGGISEDLMRRAWEIKPESMLGKALKEAYEDLTCWEQEPVLSDWSKGSPYGNSPPDVADAFNKSWASLHYVNFL